ncbi:hypothetical protein JCM3770_001913 [Rhodotorula araucariae]
MRTAGLLQVTRPRRPCTGRPLQRSPGFSTLAPRRPPLVRPARPALSPSLLLIHIGSISFASCLIPVIGARAASSRAAEVEAEDRLTPLPLAQPIQRPNPPNLQLFRLAAQLRRQIPTSPQDAAFTLRQLHLVNQDPQLFLPSPLSPSSPLPLINPETWVWRLPAAAALHSILRLLASPTPHPAADALLPIADRIAQHSLSFDTLMWGAVLRSRDQGAAREWDVRVERDKALAQPGVQPKATMPRIALTKRPRVRAAEPSVEAWQVDPVTLRPSETEQPAAACPALDRDPSSPIPSFLRPPASLSSRSIDHLFLYLARDKGRAPGALAMSSALSRLRRRRSPQALARSIDLAIQHNQLDLAAQFCADWLRQLDDTGSSPTTLVRLLRRVSLRLRNGQNSFAAVPSIQALGAIAHLSSALDYVWARMPASSGERSGAVGALVHLLVKVPVAPSPLLFKRGSPRRRHARAHVAAARMAREVLRRVLEDVVGREVHLAGPSDAPVVSIGETLSVQREVLPLGLFDLNALLAYALHRLDAPEVALAVLERMDRMGIAPSPATENILFGAFEGEEAASVERIIDRSQRDGGERAAPTLATHLSSTGAHDELERTVFRLLPELDYAVAPAAEGEENATTRLLNAHLSAARPPAPTGRSPYLYTTLLHALACAGRVGLAERVFRNARWAAELSRAATERTGRTGWILPPHAFTSMLRLYAAEVRRGQALERRGDADRAHVRGWGRHALRVFLLREQRALVAAQLGASSADAHTDALAARVGGSSSAGWQDGGGAPGRDAFRALPPFLRSVAAPLVAIYELEGGSRAPELASLRAAMRAPQSREALRVLFPPSSGSAGEEQGGSVDEGKRLSELGQRAWRRGERARLRDRGGWGRCQGASGREAAANRE